MSKEGVTFVHRGTGSRLATSVIARENLVCVEVIPITRGQNIGDTQITVRHRTPGHDKGVIYIVDQVELERLSNRLTAMMGRNVMTHEGVPTEVAQLKNTDHSRVTFTWKNAAGDTGEASVSKEALVRVDAIPVPQFGEGMHQVTFTFKNGFSNKYNVATADAERISEWSKLAMTSAPSNNGATYSLFADIVGRLFGADEANNMHREFAIWSDNLDKIIDTRVAESAPRSYSDWMKGEIEAGRVNSGKRFALVGDDTPSTRVTFPKDVRFVSHRIVPPLPPEAPESPPTRYVRDDKKPEFPSVIDRMRKQMQAEANTVRELLVDLISHSTHVREALQTRLAKAVEDDAAHACESVEMLGATESFWTHELEKHDMMVVDARRLLQVIP